MKNSFDDYNFSLEIRNTLDILKFKNPTKIQEYVIPLMRKHTNVVGVSATGSGKTHAFLLPIIEKINLELMKPQAIIMVPTRELANQLYNNVQVFQKMIPKLKVSLQVGGTAFKDNKDVDSQIVIGTPGRLLDAINKRHILKIDNIKYMVLDEADMIFDSNFIEETDQVMADLKDSVCFAIFSATITQNMHPFLKRYFENTKIVEIDNNVSENVEHIVIPSKEQDKYLTLKRLVDYIDPYLCLIFASKKEDVIELSQKLANDGIKCIQLHGDLSSRERTRTLKRINNLEFNFVVASDIAARGIDIQGVSHVISYDLPMELEYYIHRSGRTGRHNYTGISYVIASKDDELKLRKIERRGISFAYFDFIKGELKEAGLRVRDHKNLKSDNYDQQLVSKVKKKKQKVKPNYKKKRKLAIDKAKKKEKQLVIKERIKSQRKKRKKNSEFSNNDA